MTPETDGTDGTGSDPLIGREIAGYRLEALLGSGINGKVYRARRIAKPAEAAEESEATEATEAIEPSEAGASSAWPDVVAIKALLPDERMTSEQNAEFRRRLRREAETLQRLHHDNILSVLDVRTEDGDLAYMVMPYLANGTLAKLMSIGTLPFAEVERIITQLASALDYAHAQGFVHRDIKPQNILMDDQGNPLLADFGLVRLLDSTRSQLSTTRFGAGTPVYLSPEQAQGQQATDKSDIYSLGVVAFQMLTGQLPFDGEELAGLTFKIAFTPPPLPRSLRPDLPEPAEAVIWQALDKQPEQRFEDAATFARALSAGLHDDWDPDVRPITYVEQANSQPNSLLFSRTTLPPASIWPSTPPPPTRPGRGRNTVPIVLGVVALVLLVALVFSRNGLGAIFNPNPNGTQGVGVAGSGGGKTPTAQSTNHALQPATPRGQPTYTPYPT